MVLASWNARSVALRVTAFRKFVRTCRQTEPILYWSAYIKGIWLPFMPPSGRHQPRLLQICDGAETS